MGCRDSYGIVHIAYALRYLHQLNVSEKIISTVRTVQAIRSIVQDRYLAVPSRWYLCVNFAFYVSALEKKEVVRKPDAIPRVHSLVRVLSLTDVCAMIGLRKYTIFIQVNFLQIVKLKYYSHEEFSYIVFYLTALIIGILEPRVHKIMYADRL